MTAPAIAVIIVAAGSGARLGAAVPKAFAKVGGVTLLQRALAGVLGASQSMQVVVVAPAAYLDEAQSAVAATSGAVIDQVTVVIGGPTRQASVAAGLAAVADGVEIVLVHDAARALAPSALVDRVAAAVAVSGCGVIPCLPVSDTIKRVTTDAAANPPRIAETVDRSDLVHAQTPQGFPRRLLDAAYAAAAIEYTDDAALFAAAGHAIEVVDGDAIAFKITTPWDLNRAELIVGAPQSGMMRTGVGVDVHAYDPTRPLWLGGLHWPDEPGLSGHSDGDALCHAICDALLSAAGLGDIGSRFGTNDPQFAGAHGDVFVAATVRLLADAGYAVGNVSVQVVARHPRLGARRGELEHHLTALVGAPVSVGATTTDGLGFTGRDEGLAAIATALVHGR